MSLGQFCLLQFLGFGCFCHFWGFVGDLELLGVRVSYKITRGIEWVVGRSTEGVKGGLREFWGFLCGEVQGGQRGSA